MINLDSLTLKAFAEENFDFFQDARVQKIQQPTRKDLILQVRGRSGEKIETRKLYININPDLYHICFLSKQGGEKRHIEIPKHPPMFCMLLRKYMENAKILRADAVENERIFELYFESYSEIGEIIPLCLAVELMGKHSNCVMYNYDTGIILGCMHNIGAEKSREREMAGGLPYIYPPKQHKESILGVPTEVLKAQIEINKKKLPDFLSENYFYLSKALVEEIVETTAYDNEIIKKLCDCVSLKNINPSVSADFKAFSLFGLREGTRQKSVNDMIDNYFAQICENAAMRDLRASLKTLANKEIKKLASNLEKQKIQAQKSQKAQEYKKKGDLLMSNLYKIEKNSKKVTLEDFETGKEIKIELDENLTPTANANRYYKLYTKAKKACSIADEMRKNTQSGLNFAQEMLYQIETAENYADLKEIYDELKPRKETLKKPSETRVREVDINGFKVYIGKNNAQNDLIYSKISAADDIWLHALNAPGAHILVKIPKGAEIDNGTLLEAAKLAKIHSKQANSGKASVIYTKRKNLKHPPDTPKGYVTYSGEKEIII